MVSLSRAVEGRNAGHDLIGSDAGSVAVVLHGG